MNDSFLKHSSSWVSFSYISFGTAAFMLTAGLYMMPLDLVGHDSWTLELKALHWAQVGVQGCWILLVLFGMWIFLRDQWKRRTH